MSSVRTAFLSSTGADLVAYRDAAFRAIQKLNGWKCSRMEDFGSRDKGVVTFDREQAESCDLFIGIIGHRFGAGPAGSKESYTQMEYRAAVGSKKPRLLFLAPDDFPVPANLQEPMWKIKAQIKFRKELRDNKDRIVALGFTGPDQLANQITTAIFNWVDETSGKRGKRPSGDAKRYLEALWDDTAYIDIRGLRVANESVHRFRIDDLYTPLTTVLAPDERQKSREDPMAGQRAVPLQQALQRRCVVLVGDPGAGKSTFLRRIAFAACETLLGRNALAAADLFGGKPCPFPLLIRAATLSNYIRQQKKSTATEHSPEWVIYYLQAAAEENNWDLDGEFFREQLSGGCLLMLDGLDEAPDKAHRKALAKLLEQTTRAYPRTQVVATSRPPSYGGETLIPGFDLIQIGPLEEDAVTTFVKNWCRALHGSDEKASQHKAELLDAIRSKPAISDMAVNPVMLTALAALHWNRTRLPDQRSELYESVLDWLAKAREEQRKDRIPAVQCLAMMEQLAYTMHSDPRGKQVEITRHAAARVLAPRFRNIEEPERAAERFLEEEETESGILVSRGNTLRYWHLTFQEYLAAKSLLWRDDDRRRLLFTEKKLYLPEWRETVLLLAGVLCKQDPQRIDEFLREMLDALGKHAALADRARCVGLIGQILQDLKSWSYQIADGRYRENLDQVLRIFDAKAAREIDFATRLEAADALGQAGDPRLEQDNWVKLEGGSFWMGAQKTDPKGKNYDPDACGDESPVGRVEVAAFWIGRYPVTVSEYARFVAEGGYRKQGYWSADGYGKFAEPGNWQRQRRYPNRPVVEVNWYESTAYCAWAGGRLPSEAEWEYAARWGAEGTRYPWGNEEPDEYRANFGRGPRHATPVGLYPEGATPSGIDDMAGNVFEWVKERVIRGCSWSSDRQGLRVSSRYRDAPDGRGVNLGFRCVRELLSL